MPPCPDWLQEVPSRMPWAARAQGVVSFTGTALPCVRQLPHAASLALKRRLEQEEPQPGPKQFLSEEKMAARFNSLSLENDHLYSANGFPAQGPAASPPWEPWLQEQRLPLAAGSEDASTAESEESGVVLEGEFSMADCTLLSLGEPGPPRDSLLAPQLLHCLNPSTELVLWAPPGSRVPYSIHTLLLPSGALAAPLLPPLCRGQPQEMEL
uniref:Host cell factor C1 regulator 1 n=1 Tax=Pelodiscus sinensis TaxID=13735 RepID=K7FBQ1_PELSI|nr:host cell factor C1 regulator 1 [Pelodiscus sinensis]|eukprot:XP_014425561.1 host cell factor C1 regulator 1 [Pelodiscus sinensis]